MVACDVKEEEEEEDEKSRDGRRVSWMCLLSILI